MINENYQFIPLTRDSPALHAALCRRRNAQIRIHIQARDMSLTSADSAEKEPLAAAAAAMYEAFAVAADIRIKRHEFEQKIKTHCDEMKEDMID